MGKTILKSLGLGILAALGAMLFAEMAGVIFNGLPWGDAAVLGGIMYLCILLVICTGVILHHIDKKRKD